jgi:hypothetical protein
MGHVARLLAPLVDNATARALLRGSLHDVVEQTAWDAGRAMADLASDLDALPEISERPSRPGRAPGAGA